MLYPTRSARPHAAVVAQRAGPRRPVGAARVTARLLAVARADGHQRCGRQNRQAQQAGRKDFAEGGVSGATGRSDAWARLDTKHALGQQGEETEK